MKTLNLKKKYEQLSNDQKLVACYFAKYSIPFNPSIVNIPESEITSDIIWDIFETLVNTSLCTKDRKGYYLVNRNYKNMLIKKNINTN